VRVYGVGLGAARRFVAFRVESTALDYRVDDDSAVIHLPLSEVGAEVVDGLGQVMDALEMDYGAADFKAEPDTGRLAFLEVNSAPMFAGFDAVSDSAVSDAILDYLGG
jgi:D-alanine-D-alanine ligase-like ATP-grasp enzyme